jgi:translocation protein SEC63
MMVACFSVIDDENPTVYTAGAIVTVTVTLVRYTLSVLLGEDTLADAIKPQDTSNFSKGDEEEEDDKKEELVNVRMALYTPAFVC